MPLEGDPTPKPVLQGEFNRGNGEVWPDGSVTWSPDGAELMYRLDDSVMAVSFGTSSGTPRIGRPRELFRGSYFTPALGGTRQYHIAPDGRFLMLKAASSGEGRELPAQVVLVQNFFEELKRLVPN